MLGKFYASFVQMGLYSQKTDNLRVMHAMQGVSMSAAKYATSARQEPTWRNRAPLRAKTALRVNLTRELGEQRHATPNARQVTIAAKVLRQAKANMVLQMTVLTTAVPQSVPTIKLLSAKHNRKMIVSS